VHGFDDGDAVVQEPFPSVREPKIHRPVVGDALTLHCQPPYGYPPGVVYWGEFRSGDKLKPIDNNERVSLDYDGKFIRIPYHICGAAAVTLSETWQWIYWN